MGKVFILDINICNGCYNCQIACKDEHVGNDWTPIAKPQPDIGQFWTKVTDIVRGTVPKVKMTYLHSLCHHCDNAPCKAVCKVEGAIYQRKDGLVIIDPTLCSGCKSCLSACPYQAIYFNEDLHIAQKCTGCAHLLDRGWKEPRCVEACPTGATIFGDEEDLKDLIAKAELLHPELDVKPRVYYFGLPKKFVAGAVYDPEIDECIEGAVATLTDLQTRKSITARTDNFGDFWLKDLGIGTYCLTIDKEGYLSQKIEPINTQKDLNLGDIALNRKK